MIRLNVFFELKEGVTLEQLTALTDELVEKSRADEGNMGYDLFQSTTSPKKFMYCETWENEESLQKHSQAPHFKRIVPQIAELRKDGTVMERFEKE